MFRTLACSTALGRCEGRRRTPSSKPARPPSTDTHAWARISSAVIAGRQAVTAPGKYRGGVSRASIGQCACETWHARL